MPIWSLKLLGIDVAATARVVAIEWAGKGLGNGWVLLSLILAAAGVWWTYHAGRGQTVAAWRTWAMVAARAAVIGLLLVAFTRPVVKVTVEGDGRRQLVVLLDDSASMSIRDARVDDADIQRAAAAGELVTPSREEIVKGVLTKQAGVLKRLARDYDLRVLKFGKDVSTAEAGTPQAGDQAQDPRPTGDAVRAALDAWKPAQGITALGDALRELASRVRGQPVAGVVLITDGANNAGAPPVSNPATTQPADSPPASTLPLFIWGVGVSRPRDLAVVQVVAPEVGFVDDEIAVVVRLRATGVEGQTARINIKLAEETVATQDLPLTADGESTVTLHFTPKKPGEFVLTAELPPLPGEVVQDNNSQIARLRIVDGKIKVLYVETAPRWEFKYLQAMLLRDRRVDAKFILLEASPTVAVSTAKNKSPYLARFPATREDLFKFDLLILGDVDPRAFTNEQLAWVEEHISRFGAGLLMIAGRARSPTLWTGTPLERVLPVEWDKPGASAEAKPSDPPIKLELTPAGRLSSMLRIAETDLESAADWARQPELYWTAPITRARPGAEVLVVSSDPARATRFGKMPVIALQQYGLGTSLFVGTDNLWRWRKNGGDLAYTRLYGQIIQRLAMAHLLGETKRTQLSADKRSYSAGETATVYARLYTPTFEPIKQPIVRGTLTGTTSSRTSVLMRALPEQPGMYRGEVVLPGPGVWKYAVETDDKTALELDVGESKIEFADTAMNEPLLRNLASRTGGAFVREEDIPRLPELIESKAEKIRTTLTGDVWASPAYFSALLALLGLEWILRKGAGLK